MTPVIECKNVVKKFDDYKAVNKVSFTVNKGELFTLLGPNGAGKTTLVKILTGQLTATSGTAQILGVNVEDILKSDMKYRISYVPQEQLIWDDLTVLENITLMGKLYGLKKDELEEKVKELLEDFGLNGHEKKRAEKLSGGMKRKLSIAMSLMNDPLLLFLDEPTTGLDVHARTLLMEDLKRLKTAGTTLVLTTHLMEEAEALSSKVLIINEGKVISSGSVEDLIEKHVGEKILQVGLTKDSDDFENYLGEKQKLDSELDYVRIKDTFFIKSAILTELMDDIMKNEDLMDDVMEINIKRGGLKETFLFITRELYVKDLPSSEDAQESIKSGAGES
jgi:ABC-type multidrug transport system ATPase subunit